MSIPTLRKLLTNNGRFKPDNPEFRRAYMLNSVLVLSIVMCALFSVLCIMKLYYINTIAIAVAALLLLAVLVFFHKTDRLKASANATMAVIFALAAVILIFTGPSHAKIIWVGVIPPLIFFAEGPS